MLLCPRSACTSRRLAPRSLRSSVAAVCRRGCAEMTGPRARSQASLIRALNAWLLKGAPSRPGKMSGDPAKSTPPTPKPHALYTFQECEPFHERVRQFFCEGQITKGASFELK